MNYKIKVHSKAESRLVQEHAFKLGARADLSTYVKNENGGFLYLRDGRITFDDRESDFKKSLCEQISVDDFIEITNLEDNLAYKSIEGENDKNIDRFKAEMKRKGYYP